jgi:nucleoside-diphosphate-sugar epimerase
VKVAVTGATGFIGRHLVEHLAARGDAVVPIGRPLERAIVARALGGADAVVHLAGIVSTLDESQFFAVNVDATREVAEAAASTGTRLVYVSSLAAAGPAPPDAPRTEDDAPAPITAYGRSKLEGERVIERTAGLRWLTLRPGVVYGPRDRALLPFFAMAKFGVLPLVGRPTAGYTFIHVRDLVRAIGAAVDSGLTGEPIFTGHPTPVLPRALLHAVRAAVGGRAAIVFVPPALLRAAALAGDLAGKAMGRPLPINGRRYVELMAEGFVCRVDRLRDRLGIVAEIGLEEGLQETARWYRDNKWL